MNVKIIPPKATDREDFSGLAHQSEQVMMQIRSHGFSLPENHHVVDEDSIHLAWPDLMVGIFVGKFDQKRHNRLVRKGWSLLYFEGASVFTGYLKEFLTNDLPLLLASRDPGRPAEGA